MKRLIVLFAVALISVFTACQDTIETTPNCQAPRPTSADTLHGQYTWTDNTGSVAKSITQYSTFQFRDNALGNPTVFTMRVDTSVLVPKRRFNDLTAKYRLLSDSLYVDTVIFQGGGGNTNVPFGLFVFICTDDSFLFIGGSTPGLSFGDTVMRVSMRR